MGTVESLEMVLRALKLMAGLNAESQRPPPRDITSEVKFIDPEELPE